MKLPLDLSHPDHREAMATASHEHATGNGWRHPCPMCRPADRAAHEIATTPHLAAEVVRLECLRVGATPPVLDGLSVRVVAELIAVLLLCETEGEAQRVIDVVMAERTAGQ